jgi:hypothetical protein
MIKHKVHYIPIKEDLSDLLHVINWCKNNDDECKKIAQNGMDFARSVLNRDFIQKYMQSILWSLCDNKQSHIETHVAIEARVQETLSDSSSDEYIDFPVDKKRCPRQYSATMHRNKKVCKKNITRKKNS